MIKPFIQLIEFRIFGVFQKIIHTYTICFYSFCLNADSLWTEYCFFAIDKHISPLIPFCTTVPMNFVSNKFWVFADPIEMRGVV